MLYAQWNGLREAAVEKPKVCEYGTLGGVLYDILRGDQTKD